MTYRILVYSASRSFGFEEKDILLASEFRRRGHEVLFGVTSDDLYSTGRFGYPGFPVEFQQHPEFLKEKACWVDSRRQLEKLVCWADVVVMSSCRVFEIVPDFYRFCQIAGTRVVIHADHTDFGTLYPPNIDAVCMQSEFF